MLDDILESLGLTRLSYYDKLKELYVEETTRASMHAAHARELKDRVEEFEHKIDEGDAEAKARWTSPDGKKVLKDLERALNYLRDYQRAMWVVLAPDNNYYLVKELLEAWGMKSHSEVDDIYARANRGIKKVDRTGQAYDSYGIAFIHGEDENTVIHTFEDIDPDDDKWRTDLTITTPRSEFKLLESGDDE